MPQIGNDKNPVVFKNKKKGNRKLGLSSKFLNKEDKQKYHQGWDRIFGDNNKKDFKRNKM
tara:strand:+ start:37 stop:216 length:180 start_codon:yes stop_codon:yes gene_type:complete